VYISQKPSSFGSQLIGLDYSHDGVVDPKPTGKNKRVSKWGWTSRKPSQKTMVGLAKPSSLSNENLQMVYLVHQLSLGESMVKYTQKVMNKCKQHSSQMIPPLYTRFGNDYEIPTSKNLFRNIMACIKLTNK